MNNEFSLSAAREARIDRAIDRAVREMMHVDPPPGLRRRVLARLTDADERRGAFLLPRYAFAAMALLVLMMSMTLMRDRIEPPMPPKAPSVAAPAGAPAIEPPIQTDVQAAPVATPSPGVTHERIRMPRVTNVFGTRSGEVSATMIDAGKHEIVVPLLKIVPLSARPIVIEPLISPPLTKGGGV